jgi:TolA-binding protein
VSARSCHRRFEVEAARDGRITGRALASIEQHVSTCKQCATDARALQRVADALAALPVAERDALSVRRQRQRLIASFNEAQLAAPTSRTGQWRIAGVFVAAALVALAAVAASRGPRVHAVTTGPEDHADDVVIVVPESARWSRTEEGSNTRVKLDDGELDVHVKHHGDAHGLLVTLPDGELEDVGTTFRVRVREGRTASIVVREGAVVFRRARSGAILLGAGDSWTADEPSANPAPSAAASTVPTETAPPSASPPKTPTVSSTRETAGRDAKEFRDAVDLLNAGDAARAAAALRTYLARRPAAERTEDATYLLVLPLRRSGDVVGAEVAARDYVRLYPHGLRRREIEGLAPAATTGP